MPKFIEPGLRVLLALLFVPLGGLLAAGTAVAAGLGEGCSVFNQCDHGLSCQPFVHKCFHKPRREGEPCSLGYGCAPGLTCEAGVHKCRAPGKVGDRCHATKPCGKGLSCQPGVHKCYHVPRRAGEPCVAGHPCGPGLRCEAGSHLCRAPGKVGDACHATRPCGPGLSCQPGVHKCYHVPRKVGEPCVAGHSCGPGLSCQAFSQRCFPGNFSWDNKNSCLSVRDEAIAREAQRTGITTTYGSGSIQTLPLTLSEEIGVVYGSKGEFGCYFTTCGGFSSDVSISAYAAVGEFNAYDSVEGDAYVYAGGGSPVPFFEVGNAGVSVVVATDFDNPAHASNKAVGSVQTLGVGVGLAPAQGAALKCVTEVQHVLGPNGTPVSDDVVGGENFDCIKTAFEDTEDWAAAVRRCRTGGTAGGGSSSEQTCFDAVQGKVAWNRAGSTGWVDSNVRKLCAGTTDPAATIACFEEEIRKHDNWSKAIETCAR
jgi:hypothetical protein